LPEPDVSMMAIASPRAVLRAAAMTTWREAVAAA